MTGRRIRGITIELDGNVGPLSKALEGVNKQSKNLQTELRDVERLLKLDPKSTELLTQRKKLLAEAVKTSADRLQTLKTAQEQAAKAFERGEIGEEQYRAIQREVIEATQELKALEAQLRDVNDRFKQAADKVRGFGEGLKGAGEAMMPVSAAAGAAVGGIVAMTVKSAQEADEINTLAKQTGLSTEQIQLLRYASERIDVPLETLTGSMAKLTRNMYAASEQTKLGRDRLTGAALAFDTLGVSVTNADGSLRNNQDVMADVIDALAAKTNATERDALAMQIFGKSAQDLNPLILGGADAMKQMSQEANDLGLILDQDALDRLNAFNDELDKTKAQLAATGAVVAVEFSDVLMPILKQVAEFIQNIAERMRGMDEGTAKLILVVLALVAVAAPLLIILGQVAMGISAIIALVPKIIAATTAMKTFFLGTATKAGLLTKVIVGLKAAFAVLLGPIGLVIAAVTAVVAIAYLVVKNWETIGPFFAGLWQSVKEIFSAAWERIKQVFFNYTPLGLVITHWQTIIGFFSGLWATVTGIFNTALAAVRGVIQGVWSFVSERFTSMVSHVRTVLSGIRDAIVGPFERAWEAVRRIANRIRDALNAINPFARFSPSLVDNVRAGVRAIQNEYAKLEHLQLPSVAAMGPQVAGVGAGAAAGAVYHGPLVMVQNMHVRSDDDIKNISRQLQRDIQSSIRARGGR